LSSPFWRFCCLPLLPALRAQAPAAPASVEANRKALNALFEDYWQDNLKHSPEFASTLGDKRYNDQISDYSVKAVNDRLAREQNFLLRLAAIDPAGLTDQEKTSRDLLLRQFAEDEEAADFKEWEMPVTQMGGIHTRYPQLAAQLSFTTVKDYDDWIARLHAIPKQPLTRSAPTWPSAWKTIACRLKYLLEKALAQVKQLAGQKPEDSPLALPLKKFPAGIQPAEQERIKAEMLDAIGKEVLPAYLRFARFLEVSYVPAGREQPGISALPDGAKYYQFLIRRTHHHRPDRGADSPDRPRRSKARRGRDAGHCAEARLCGPGQLPRQPQDQSQAEAGLGRGAARRLPRLPDPDAGRCRSSLAACPRRPLRWSRFPTT
jgi:uncharacterized protein (DUF885 family)